MSSRYWQANRAVAQTSCYHRGVKTTLLLLLACLVVAGCSKSSDKIASAPRTETASKVAGWTEFKTSGIAISFPDDWKTIDLTKDDLAKAIDVASG